MTRRGILLGASSLLAAPALIWAAAEAVRPSDPLRSGRSQDVLADPAAAEGGVEPLLSALLLVVYEAFGRTDEAEIYDTLARTANGAALERLYLERAGAMAGGGLTEADQQVHEMRVVSAAAQPPRGGCASRRRGR